MKKLVSALCLGIAANLTVVAAPAHGTEGCVTRQEYRAVKGTHKTSQGVARVFDTNGWHQSTYKDWRYRGYDACFSDASDVHASYKRVKGEWRLRWLNVY